MVIGAAAAAIVLAALVLARPWETEEAPGTGTLPVPAAGQTIAAFAGDGRPLWVVGHEDGTISVLDAFSTHVPYGVNKATWWCEADRFFEDPFHGSRYTEFGDRLGGPAPMGLPRYAFTETEGGIRLADRMEPRPAAGPGVLEGGDATCPADEAVVHDYAALPAASGPSGAAGATSGGWQRVHARLIPRPEEASAMLCWASTAVGPDDCATVENLPEMAQYVPGPDDQFSADLWNDADWLVRAELGRILEIALLPPH